MSADDDFLARWSRRKQAAADADKAPTPKADAPKQDDQVAGREHGVDRREGADTEFDITKLPPIDSITAISDVRDFLRVGVPAELTRAALRRAWSADPSIRDFIGLAENAWDFTDPNAMPGFGPLHATDNVRQMVEQIMSRVGEATPSPDDRLSDQDEQTSETAQVFLSSATETPDERSDEPHVGADITGVERAESKSVAVAGAPQVDIAAQQEGGASQPASQQEQKILRRTHGGALPH